MKTQVFIFLMIVIFIVANNIPSVISAYRDKDFCYDQVGDGQFCFDKEKQCEKKLKNDNLAESPCYNKDVKDWSLVPSVLT